MDKNTENMVDVMLNSERLAANVKDYITTKQNKGIYITFFESVHLCQLSCLVYVSYWF
jgi:hypothetical protein